MSLGKKLALFAITLTIIISNSPALAQSTLATIQSQVTAPILASGIAAIGLTALGMITTILYSQHTKRSEIEIKKLEELAKANKKQQCNSIYIDEINQPSINSLIKYYHTQALTQASTQFWFSITAASFGFILILYTGFTALASKEPKITLLNILPGIAIEAVAALFFTQAENTRKRATQLYDRLRADEKQTQAIAIIESIDDDALRNLVKAQWALQFAGFQSQPLDLNPYLPQSEINNDDIYNNQYCDN
jgi:hypothetical protein